MRTPPIAAQRAPYLAPRDGIVTDIDNRLLARVAKLAGAPADPAAGVDCHVRVEDPVVRGQPLFTIHADTHGELAYAQEYLAAHPDLVRIEDR
jgi:thymidine phosphorylase